MFRRSSSTATTTPALPDHGAVDDRTGGAVTGPDAGHRPGGLSGLRESHRRRAVRRARLRDAADDAALRARVDRMQRRLAQVGAVQVTPRHHGIDNDAARRDPMTRPFSMPVDGPRGDRRIDTAALARPA